MFYLYVALSLIAVLVVAGLVIPSRFRIVRKNTIQASPAAVHAFVGHLEKWPEWMPWEQDDPSIITTRSDQTTGRRRRNSGVST